MSDGNDTKTKEQLLAELDALKQELEQRGVDARKVGLERSAAPVFSVPITRRQSLVSWVAPVILSLPVVQGVGMVLKPGTAYAADDGLPSPTAAPTAKPTVSPSAAPTIKAKAGAPTAKPTFSPTASPTFAPTAAPTATPTIAPTRAGRCIVAPTAAPPTTAPIVAPTLGMGAAPDSRSRPLGALALGSARAVSRGHLPA